jgi:hypothetical protein
MKIGFKKVMFAGMLLTRVSGNDWHVFGIGRQIFFLYWFWLIQFCDSWGLGDGTRRYVFGNDFPEKSYG